MADSNEVLSLLRIADLSKQWPHLKSIHDHAMDQLQKIAAEHAPTAPKYTPGVLPRRTVSDSDG